MLTDPPRMERTEAQKLKDLNKQIQDLRVKVRTSLIKGTLTAIAKGYGLGIAFIVLSAPLVWLGKYLYSLL